MDEKNDMSPRESIEMEDRTRELHKRNLRESESSIGRSVNASGNPHVETDPNGNPALIVLPSGWMYKPAPRFLRRVFPWYASPKVQLAMVSFVCFLCPGMFNALGGLGGGGKLDATLADNMNVAVYSTFAAFGFIGGSIVNRIGIRFTLAIGGLGYFIYAMALLLSEHYSVDAFAIVAGALLGFCAALLWTAQGTIMVAYPYEKDKGKFFGWFWAIFNMGAVIGSLIPLGENITVKANKTVSDGTYIAFIILMFAGAALALCLCDGNYVVRSDGTRVVMKLHPTWISELKGMWDTLRYEPFVVCLFPMFWSSNWFYTYQQNGINGAHFSTRTKALNNCLYYMAQIVGAIGLGYLLDIERIPRGLRAKINHVMLFVITLVIWGAGWAWQKDYDRDITTSPDFVPTDWETPGYVGPMFLYIFYGLYDSLWQASVYWYMGCLSNSGRHTSNYVGFYKGIQSAGAAVIWSLDSRKISFFSEYVSTFGLLAFSILCAGPIIWFKITDSTAIEKDLAGTGETKEQVDPLGVTDREKNASVVNVSPV